MRLQPLYDLQQDLNRLFIAGSKFAKGDPRLSKHIIVLNKLGEKAPVFKKIANDVEELMACETPQSAEKLMATSVLLHAVLYTQGELVETDLIETKQNPTISVEKVNTNATYSQLSPVINALTTVNPGRLEIVKDAFEQNIFADTRTYQHLDFALADKYGELCYYVENTIIPSIGEPMIPFLNKGFTYEDKSDNARRFRLLNRFGASNTSELIQNIFKENLPMLQAEAVYILSRNPENESFIIDLANDKHKQVREASYIGLATLNSKLSLEKLKNIYLNNKNKSEFQPLITALASSKLPFFFTEIYQQVLLAFEDFKALEKATEDKVLVAKLDHFIMVLEILKNKENKASLQFLAEVIQDKQFSTLIASKKSLLAHNSNNVFSMINAILDTYTANVALQFWEDNISKMADNNSIAWHHYFERAVEQGYSREKLYDVFSAAFALGAISVYTLYQTAYDHERYFNRYESLNTAFNTNKIDPRWLVPLYALFSGKVKYSVQIEYALRIIDAVEPKPSKIFKSLLLEIYTKLQAQELPIVFKLMMKNELENRFELIYTAIEKNSKNANHYVFRRLEDCDFWTHFPKEYVAKFTQLFEKTKSDVYQSIAAEIEANTTLK
ncbi:HEAT repeat domain-containing protein [Flavobacterium sp. PL002]|uniref:HEAT repeat domain-containing protein n=1 Tax=Flavobacterium sp. PL002 TaxID=1897058 RepID=UPI00178851F5|nr:HEAT repeat domain-containing protein [Flavobacterium sp. PL002]MBE0390334.1 hypothetical protein [Flavobacterium sp. PL002]